MAKRQRVIHTRGNAAETPNWRFSLSTSIARKDVPELCQGLAFIVGERKGGSYYYPDYVDGKTAAAFEWYRPYRRRIFGYKIGVEFWIEETNLEKLGVYVLYGEDHPKRGYPPEFTVPEQHKFQNEVIDTISLATKWRTQLPFRQFHTIHYIKVAQGVIRRAINIPALDASILPTVVMGKENARVSAVIQTIPARFRDESKEVGGRNFLRLCAMLTLATGTLQVDTGEDASKAICR